jgi:hypothetical protein
MKIVTGTFFLITYIGKMVRAGAGIVDKPEPERHKKGPAPQHCHFGGTGAAIQSGSGLRAPNPSLVLKIRRIVPVPVSKMAQNSFLLLASNFLN